MELFVVDSNLTPAKTYFCGFFASEVLKSVNFSKKMKIICKKFGKYKIPPYLCTKKSNKYLNKQNLHKIMTISNNSKMQLAVQMVIMDAIEKGHTNSNELIDYMQSDVFATAAKSYFEMLNQI